jgi:hypothetical protein
MHLKKVTNYVENKQRFCRLNQTPPTGNMKNPPTCPWPLPASFGHFSHLWSWSQKTTTPPALDCMGRLCFHVSTTQMPNSNLGFIFCWVLYDIWTFLSAWILIINICCIYHVYLWLCRLVNCHVIDFTVVFFLLEFDSSVGFYFGSTLILWSLLLNFAWT